MVGLVRFEILRTPFREKAQGSDLLRLPSVVAATRQGCKFFPIRHPATAYAPLQHYATPVCVPVCVLNVDVSHPSDGLAAEIGSAPLHSVPRWVVRLQKHEGPD